MTFNMPVFICGCISFSSDNGSKINQIYVLNSDPDNQIYKGFVPAKMSCDQKVFDALSSDISKYPFQVTVSVRNKTSGGKTVQHVVDVVQSPLQKKAS